MAKKDPDVGKMEAQLQQWGARLDELMAKAETASADVKSDLRKSVADLKKKHHVAQVKLEELKAAGGDEWESLKAGLASVWSELETSITKLTR